MGLAVRKWILMIWSLVIGKFWVDGFWWLVRWLDDGGKLDQLFGWYSYILGSYWDDVGSDNSWILIVNWENKPTCQIQVTKGRTVRLHRFHPILFTLSSSCTVYLLCRTVWVVASSFGFSAQVETSHCLPINHRNTGNKHHLARPTYGW